MADDTAAGVRTVHCIKLDRDLPGLDRPPFKDELGEKLFDGVSQEAWNMWNTASVPSIRKPANSSKSRPKPTSSAKALNRQRATSRRVRIRSIILKLFPTNSGKQRIT